MWLFLEKLTGSASDFALNNPNKSKFVLLFECTLGV